MTDTPAPAYRVPDTIAWVDGADLGLAEELYLTVVPDGTTVLLKDTARLIWLAAITTADVQGAVAAQVGLPANSIADDVTLFLADLASQGLLAG